MSSRVGRDAAQAILRGKMKLEKTRLSFRRNLAETAILRLLDPPTRESKLLAQVVGQAFRDIGGREDSLGAWRRGELDIFLEAFGAEPECCKDILRTLHLWEPRDVRPHTEKAARQAQREALAARSAAEQYQPQGFQVEGGRGGERASR